MRSITEKRTGKLRKRIIGGGTITLRLMKFMHRRSRKGKRFVYCVIDKVHFEEVFRGPLPSDDVFWVVAQRRKGRELGKIYIRIVRIDEAAQWYVVKIQESQLRFCLRELPKDKKFFKLCLYHRRGVITPRPVSCAACASTP